jgi:hypothetical protein
LRPVLRPLLRELCGSRLRAAFWQRFAMLMLLVAPLLPVIHASHSLDEPPVILLQVIRDALRYTLLGQFSGLLITGYVIRSHIPGAARRAASPLQGGAA